MANDRVMDMTEGNIWKQLTAFAVPFLLTNVFQQFYTTADAAIVGRAVGTGALAAVGASDKISILMINLFLGLSTGTNILASQAFGKKDKERFSKVLHSSIAISLLSGLILTVMGLMLAPAILRLISTPEEIMDITVLYTRIYFLCMIPLMIYNMGAAVLRALGDSKSSLYYLMASGVLNVVLDMIFVVGFSWGIAGAAIATVLTQVLPAVLVVIRLVRMKGDYRLKLSKVRLYRKETVDIMKVGFPAGIRLVFVKLSNLVIQGEINSFGVAAMAGATLFYKLDGYTSSTATAMSLAVTSFAGQNYGAHKLERVKQGKRTGIIMATIVTASLSVILLIFAEPLCHIFTDDPETIYYGVLFMQFLLPAYVMFSWNEVLNGVVLSSGKSLIPMANHMFGMCIARLAFCLIALSFVRDIRMVYLCYPFSWLVTHIGIELYYRFGKWAYGKRFSDALKD